MILAAMIATDEDALICDFAETYHIYNYRELPCRMAALFASGLSTDSRIVRKMSGMEVGLKEMLLSIIADKLAVLVWQNTEDGHNGVNAPESIYQTLCGHEEESEYEVFDSGEEFERRRLEIFGGR